MECFSVICRHAASCLQSACMLPAQAMIEPEGCMTETQVACRLSRVHHKAL